MRVNIRPKNQQPQVVEGESENVELGEEGVSRDKDQMRAWWGLGHSASDW